MRRRLICVLVALIYSTGWSAPRKTPVRRTGPFAKYIDPAAPEDRPRPPVRRAPAPSWLSVVILIDRASTEGDALDALREAAQTLHARLDDDDQSALLSFDTVSHRVLRAARVAKNGKKLATTLVTITRSPRSDLAAGLEDARAYLANAPDNRVVFALTDARQVDEAARIAIASLEKANMTVVIVVPELDAARSRALGSPNSVVVVDRAHASELPFDLLRYPHRN